MQDTVIEMVSYKLKAGVSREDLAATQEQVNGFLQTLPGFMYRSVAENDSGVLYDVVYWQDMASAKAADEAFMSHAAGKALMAIADEQSVSMSHMPVLSQAQGQCSAA
ncbi:hypothetical protein SG34_008685 [Thalassomonas viridans]|uniref:ABM domain-containing protein n=1 Tax=Thalassomonas viridans TaxID=137584 RepID=A0AAE9Z5F8_9GAMM|nr:hypothetical protein [Thalassomonas viridans]WDE06948.1 hypothetical protein SG34_008685 [Thalassomonas viridans]